MASAEETSKDLSAAAEAYLNLRNAREKLKQAYESEDAELKGAQEIIERKFMEAFNEINVNSFNTDAATVMRQVKERFISSDWDSFRKWELQNPEYDFRERRIHQGNFGQYMKENSEAGLPPGVNVMREFQVIVRKK